MAEGQCVIRRGLAGAAKKIVRIQWNKSQMMRLPRCDRRAAFSSRVHCSIVPLKLEEPMRNMFARLTGALLVLALTSGLAAAQTRITIAVGGGACLCYLPTVLAKQLGEYDKAGLAVELVDLKGGSDALKAVLGGSADLVSGYFDHCVNLAARKQELTSFVVYDRYPGLVLVVSPSHNAEIKSIEDLAGKKVGVSAPGSSTDFFLKYHLAKNGVDPNSVGVIGIGLAATAVVAMEQGSVDAAIMLDPAITLLQGKNK